MSKKDVYRFWALFDTSNDGIAVSFPDLPGCFTSGDTADEAYVAREALEGFLYLMEQDAEHIPTPSPLDLILKQADVNEAACEIQVYMPTVLQEGLKRGLGIDKHQV
ncbi:type II toxin-antitoxin system HicB family antitoxin [Paenibacillus turicensis]|uniref:type II toxin-antitoxin system HicB family antitoxin n=1 Tax=Paenibacillus turicensis TaxID=160487 RepID=UPI003D2D5B72